MFGYLSARFPQGMNYIFSACNHTTTGTDGRAVMALASGTPSGYRATASGAIRVGSNPTLINTTSFFVASARMDKFFQRLCMLSRGYGLFWRKAEIVPQVSTAMLGRKRQQIALHAYNLYTVM